MIQLPEIFETRMRELLCAEYENFIASYQEVPLRGLRLNLLKTKTLEALPPNLHSLFVKSEAKALTDENREIEHTLNFNGVRWCKTGFTFSDSVRPSKSIAYAAGLFYIQEPSAMCPGEVLGVLPGERVLDMCAAPGGKSAQIAGHLQGRGLLVANDASPSRSRALVKNLERTGVTNAIVLTEQPKKLAARFPGFFDRVLVDAPCSGEGMFRRDADAVKAYTANKPEACVLMQMEILHHAAALLRPGGRLVYSTCTFNSQENEGVIAAFLAGHEEFAVVPIDHDKLGISPGRWDWVENTTHRREDIGGVGRIWPHLADGEGHFVACLQKRGEESRVEQYRQNAKLPKEFQEFCSEHLKNFDTARPFTIHGTSLYLQPEEIELRGLRVARSGWYAGELSKGRFEPSQALAMGINMEDAVFSIELSESDAWRYLRGESLANDSIDASKKKPWVLICHDGFPLGWAKLVQGRLKNQLPIGWVIK